MAYIDTRQRPSPAGIAAVLAVHGALGVALVVGLSVSGVIAKQEILTGITIAKPTPPPPPPVEPDPEPTQARTVQRPIVVPRPPIPFPRTEPDFATTNEVLPPLPQPSSGDGGIIDRIVPTPVPTFAAVAARPRNDPNRWVTTEDYRSTWIRQDMTGKARFRLAIAADGRVSSCTITASSGQAALDAATCALVTQRARFQPARDGEGGAIAGTYSSIIDWQLPR